MFSENLLLTSKGASTHLESDNFLCVTQDIQKVFLSYFLIFSNCHGRKEFHWGICDLRCNLGPSIFAHPQISAAVPLHSPISKIFYLRSSACQCSPNGQLHLNLLKSISAN